MCPETGLRWSPWFRIMAENFLPRWWEDLDATLKTSKCEDYATIHRLEPPAEFTSDAGYGEADAGYSGEEVRGLGLGSGGGIGEDGG